MAHRPIDRIPTEIAHEHQRSPHRLGQGGGGRRHIRQHQQRLPLLQQPGALGGQLRRQLLLQALERRKGGVGVGAEGIGLQHPHIPAAGAVLERHRAEGQPQERLRQRRGEHQTPLGLKAVQGREHRGHPGAMAVAMAADAGVDQHGSRAASWWRVCR